jgi:hypothetical protein
VSNREISAAPREFGEELRRRGMRIHGAFGVVERDRRGPLCTWQPGTSRASGHARRATNLDRVAAPRATLAHCGRRRPGRRVAVGDGGSCRCNVQHLAGSGR